MKNTNEITALTSELMKKGFLPDCTGQLTLIKNKGQENELLIRLTGVAAGQAWLLFINKKGEIAEVTEDINETIETIDLFEDSPFKAVQHYSRAQDEEARLEDELTRKEERRDQYRNHNEPDGI